jgi:preprotein translocase subunit SecE
MQSVREKLIIVLAAEFWATGMMDYLADCRKEVCKVGWNGKQSAELR